MGIVAIRRLFFCAWVFFSACIYAGEKPLTRVADLRYGVALFHYYQDDYQAALTELLVAEKRGGIKGHGDNPEIMEGGFSLGYGMERHASEIFERLLAENRSVKVQDAAWFFLSKLRYLRGDWAAANDAIDRVRVNPDKSIYDEVNAHRVNLAIQQNQLSEASDLIRRQRDKKGWLPYLYFNLGSAYARNRQFDVAVQYFEKLDIKKELLDEHKALYDQAMTAAGYSYVFLKNYPKAIEFFSKVRLTSALSNRALLGYGWAAAELEDYEEALKPWLYLAEQTLVDENSLEAMVAVPYAYEELGSSGLALEYYQSAETRFVGEIDKLDDVIGTMHGETMIQALQIEGSRSLDWLKYAKSKDLEPRLSYLADLFAKESFQGFVRELRDLIAIRENLENWKTKLDFYDETINTRQTDRNNKQEVLSAGEHTELLNEIKVRRDAVATSLDDISANEDFLALANEEKALLDRVLRVRKNIELLRETDPFIDESEEQARWYYGILVWDAAEKFSDRRWKVEKTLASLDRSIAAARKSHQSVNEIIENAPDLDPKKVLVAEYRARLDEQMDWTDRVIESATFDLSNNIVAILKEQRRRLNIYLGQTRLSIARLYDTANPQAWEADLDDDPEVLDQGDLAPNDSVVPVEESP